MNSSCWTFFILMMLLYSALFYAMRTLDFFPELAGHCPRAICSPASTIHLSTLLRPWCLEFGNARSLVNYSQPKHTPQVKGTSERWWQSASSRALVERW
jgi:hypothetical protein